MLDFRFKSLLKGMGSQVLPHLRTTHVVGGTVTAEHCYAIFMRHFTLLEPYLPAHIHVPQNVAELGPGSSAGTGLAALLSGAQNYSGLDLLNHQDRALNAAVLEDLIPMFQSRKMIPCDGNFANMFPKPKQSQFPKTIGTHVSKNLSADRLNEIRDSVRLENKMVNMIAPWNHHENLRANSMDWIWSHSVMEHVDQLLATYTCLASWLRPGGFATHLIDFASHGLSRNWNGHWAIPSTVWRLIRGRRPYLLNRVPYSEHRRILEKVGFEILLETAVTRQDGLRACEFAVPFRNMSERDAATHMMFVVARKNGNSPDSNCGSSLIGRSEPELK